MTKPMCPNCKNVDYGALLPSDHGWRFFFTRCGKCNHGYMFNAKGEVHFGHAEQAPSKDKLSDTRPTELPDVLFDGYSVLCALTEQAKRRTSAENVSDVLDAVVKLLKFGVTRKGSSDEPLPDYRSTMKAAECNEGVDCETFIRVLQKKIADQQRELARLQRPAPPSAERTPVDVSHNDIDQLASYYEHGADVDKDVAGELAQRDAHLIGAALRSLQRERTAQPPAVPSKFDLAFEIMRLMDREELHTLQSCQFGYVMRVEREKHTPSSTSEPPADQCATCPAPLPPMARWSMPSCPACVDRADLIQRLENISNYEPDDAHDVICDAIKALRAAQPPIPALRDLLKPIELDELIEWHKLCGECCERSDDFAGARRHRERRAELVGIRAGDAPTKEGKHG